MTRRDKCYLIGRRAQHVSQAQAAVAWRAFAKSLENFGDRDIPKFNDLLCAIRQAHLFARSNR